jgi:outer membrane protein assembly factor BamB
VSYESTMGFLTKRSYGRVAIALLLVVALAAGCSSSSSDTDTETTAAETAVETTAETAVESTAETAVETTAATAETAPAETAAPETVAASPAESAVPLTVAQPAGAQSVAVARGTVANDGRYSGVTVSALKPAWTVTKDFFSYRRPVVAYGRVVLATKGEEGFVAFDAATGEQVWTRPIFAIWSAVIAISNQYVLADDEVMTAHDPATGTEKWRVELERNVLTVTVVNGNLALITKNEIKLHDPATGAQIKSILMPTGFTGSVHGVDGSVVIAAGMIVEAPTVAAVDTASGKTLWTTPMGFAAEDVILTPSTVLAIESEKGITALDRTSGELTWSKSWADLDEVGYDYDSYAIANDALLLVLGFPGLRLTARSLADGSAVWETGEVDEAVQGSDNPIINQFSDLIGLDSGVGAFVRNASGTFDFVQFDSTGKETGRIATELSARLDGAGVDAPQSIAIGEATLVATTPDVVTAWTITP